MAEWLKILFKLRDRCGVDVFSGIGLGLCASNSTVSFGWFISTRVVVSTSLEGIKVKSIDLVKLFVYSQPFWNRSALCRQRSDEVVLDSELDRLGITVTSVLSTAFDDPGKFGRSGIGGISAFTVVFCRSKYKNLFSNFVFIVTLF